MAISRFRENVEILVFFSHRFILYTTHSYMLYNIVCYKAYLMSMLFLFIVKMGSTREQNALQCFLFDNISLIFSIIF